MAKKKVSHTKKTTVPSKSLVNKNLSSFNFILFLTLALILLVVIVTALKGTAQELRARAGLGCPNPLAAFNGKLPSTSDCDGTWKLTTSNSGCQVFVCQ